MTIIFQWVGLLFSTLVALLLYKVARVRSKFYNRPKPPHSAVFGHWLLLLRQWMDYPWDSFFANILDGIQRKFDLPPIFFLDLWPLFPPVVCVSDPDVARKITVEDRAPRWPSVFEPLAPAASQRWIQTLSQNNWTKNHSIFGSSFTTSRFVRMIPAMTEDLQALDQMLAKCAKTGQIFKMETITKFSILEMTGRVLFGRQLDTFSENSEWSALYEGAVGSIPAARNPFKRPFIMQTWRTRCEDFHTLIRNEVYACFRERDSHLRSKPSLLHSSLTAYQNNKLPQFPVNIGDNEQMTEKYVEDLVSRSAAEKAPPDVTNMASCSCAGIFLAAVSGSTALSYCLMLLYQHPDIAQRVRAEHDDIFSPDRDITLQLLKTNPERLNQLVLTLAVIKETLRLFSMGAILRQPNSEHIISPEGQMYPIRDHVVVLLHTAMHRRSDLFPEPDKFDPDRFLPDARRKIPPDAWRPFEKGRGNCTGQELALIQLKLVLLLTVRRFDFELAYDSQSTRGPDIYGGLAYVTMSGTGPTPAGGMPMRAVRRVD